MPHSSPGHVVKHKWLSRLWIGVPVELLDIGLVVGASLPVPNVIPPCGVKEYGVRHMPIAPRVAMGGGSFPDDLCLEKIVAKNLVEHHLDVMAGMPVAVIVKAACFFEDASELHASRAHELDIGLS